MRHIPIQVGSQFGRLTVICESILKEASKAMQFWCECSCGEMHSAIGTLLRSGNTSSCGCLQRELVRARKTIHGYRRTVEYRAYHAAKNRCTNIKDENYKGYGGRGIQFKLPDFIEFYKELGPRPANMTLDRIDNSGNYEIGNVRWATKSQQAFNRRPKGSN